MLYPFASVPLLRIALCFIPGIWLGRYYSLMSVQAGMMCLALLILWTVSFVYGRIHKRFWPEAGLLLLSASFCLGWMRSSEYYAYTSELRAGMHEGRYEMIVRVKRLPSKTQSGKWKIQGRIDRLITEDTQFPLDAGILIICPQLPDSVSAGDRLKVRGTVQAVSDTAQGYASYLLSNGILFTLFTSEVQSIGAGNTITEYAGQVSTWCKAQYFHFIPESESAGLSTALVTGDRSALDKETAQHHRMLGTTHILSVSGLHVGLICMMLVKIFSGLSTRWTKGKNLSLILIIIILAGYAFLTGLAPSVCRAVIMTQLVMFGQLIRRQIPMSNALSCTLIIELSWEPAWLYYPGFQLSFAALAGLLWFQPGLKRLWEPEAYFLSKIWDMSTASIAAQWFTLPFLIPISEGFPVYFLPANLIIVPLASCLTSLSFLLILFSPIPVLASCVGILIKYMSLLLDLIAAFMSRLPGATFTLPSQSLTFACCMALALYILAGIVILCIQKYFPES